MNPTRAALLTAGSKVVVRDGAGRARTGAELVDSVDGLAGALAERDLAGRRIGVWFGNGIAAIEATLAVEWLGATRVPIDPGAPPAEAAATWDAAGVSGRLVDVAHAGSGELVHDEDTPLAGAPLLPLDAPAERTALLYPRAVQAGRLVAVPISYGNWDATMTTNIALYRKGVYGSGFGADECFLTVQQLMHGTGLVGTFPFLRMGLPQVILPRFDADAVLELIREGTVTATMMVTGMMTRLASAAARRPGSLGSLRRLLYGGSPADGDQLRSAVDVLGDVLVQVHGRLEGGWPITVLDQDDHRAIADGDADRATSCGRPVGEVHLRPSGELCVRSSMVVAEYADPDGSCSLGDHGRFDERGYLHLAGRTDRMINTGYHVYPEEIEEAVRRIPGVADVLVRGEPDPAHGQAVVAHLVADEGQAPDTLAAAVAAELRSRLAGYKMPRRFVVSETLPSN